jgi:acyl-ACP thioesterase
MKSNGTYKKKYHIELSDVDFMKTLKLSKLFNYFQDIASDDVESQGAGIDILEEKYGAAWVLIRIRVDIFRMPAWNEDILLETWYEEPRKLDIERNFTVRDFSGNIIAEAVSTWVIIDIKTREIKKIELIGLNKTSCINEKAIDCKFEKLKNFGQLTAVYEKTIGYSDIDFNGHINNSRYVDYIMDCFNVESHMKYDVKTIEINYVNEALPGEIIAFNRDISALNSNLLYIEGFNEENNKTIFKSQVEIKENKRGNLDGY